MTRTTSTLAVALLLGLAACNRTEPSTSTAVVAAPTAVASPTTATVDTLATPPTPEPTVAAETIPEPPTPEPVTQAPYSPEEIRTLCASVRRNAQDLGQLNMALNAQAKGLTPLSKMMEALDGVYQYDPSLELPDNQRQQLSSTLWVTTAFVDQAKGVHQPDPSGAGERMWFPPDFADAATRWCIISMQGDQTPFTYLGQDVPYISITRR